MGELSNDDRLGGWARALLLATVFVVVWYLLFRLAALGEVQTGASIWYLPAGWTIAFVMVFGRWAWPITVLGPVITGLIHPSGIEGAVETTETDRAQDSREAASATVLLVEDESGVRKFAAEVLRRRGYRVLTAQNPEEAQQVCRGFADPIDLLVTDIVMPGMSGQELAATIQPRRPEMSVLYMSGYPALHLSDRLNRASAFLAKPFSPAELAEKVSEVLGPD